MGISLLPEFSRLGISGIIPAKPAQQDKTKAEKIPLTPFEQAQKEMNLYGITADQRKGYAPRLSETLYKVIIPQIYERPAIGTIAWKFLSGSPEPQIGEATEGNKARKLLGSGVEDSWRLYLGLPQRSKTFSVSPYRPSISKEDKNYFRVNGFFDVLLNDRGWLDASKYLGPKGKVTNLLGYIDKAKDGRLLINDDFGTDYRTTGIMAHLQLSKGKDEKGSYIAMYDKWDLHARKANLVGRPYEIYDRLYYDPKTFKPIPEAQLQSVVPLKEVDSAEKKTARSAQGTSVQKGR